MFGLKIHTVHVKFINLASCHSLCCSRSEIWLDSKHIKDVCHCIQQRLMKLSKNSCITDREKDSEWFECEITEWIRPHSAEFNTLLGLWFSKSFWVEAALQPWKPKELRSVQETILSVRHGLVEGVCSTSETRDFVLTCCGLDYSHRYKWHPSANKILRQTNNVISLFSDGEKRN